MTDFGGRGSRRTFAKKLLAEARLQSEQAAAGVPVGIADGDYGDVTVSGGGTVIAIDAGTVTLAKQASLAANSIIGNNTGAPATPLALTATQVKTLLAIANTDVSGLGTLSTQSGTFSGTSSGTNTGDQTSVSGNAGTSTALATGRTIGITGAITYTSPAFDGSGNVTASSTLNTTLDAVPVPVASVNFADQQALSFRIENRTSDPGTPTIGQIWLRTDL